jgi:hypothetical protein
MKFDKFEIRKRSNVKKKKRKKRKEEDMKWKQEYRQNKM